MKTTIAGAVLIGLLVLAGMSSSDAQPAHRKAPSPAPYGKSDTKGWLGVSTGVVNPEMAKEMKLKTTTGAFVHEVVDGSPAEKAGIEEDDLITEFNGKPIADAEELVAAVRGTKPDETVPVVVLRHDQKKSLNVTVGRLPSPPHPMAAAIPPMPSFNLRIFRGQDAYGLQTSTLNNQLGEYFGAPNGRGVLVEKVSGKSAAAKAGFKAGDVICRLDNEDVTETEDLQASLQDYREGDTATFQILRKGSSLKLTLVVPEEREMNHGMFRHELFKVPEGHNHWFNNERFQEDMQRMKEELRNLGQNIRDRVQGMREKIKRELRQVGT
jgi:S1-C subfamily serine protease